MAIANYFVPAIGGGVLMTICWILGHYEYSFLWISAFVILSVLNSKMWRQRERRVLALQQAALKEKEVVLAQLRDLPAWVQFPDTERVEWLNRVIYQLWPYLGEFTKNFIKDEVEPRVKALLPGPFKSFTFESIDMGDIPLRVGGIKVYTENVGRDRIIMDMDVAYAGDCDFVVSIGAFRAGLRQMQFKGKLRTILKPLIPKPPLVGGVSAFFLDEPTIDFDLTGLGELVELPGLLGAVRSVINSQVAAICVLPNEIVVPLTNETDVVKLYFPEPDGVVRIHILEARNLENQDIGFRGKSDPYVRMSVGAQCHKTRTIDNTLDPVWDEYFEAVVDQASGQRIFIELYDEDVASADEFLGRLSIELSVVRHRGFTDEWYALEGVKRGDLHLRLFWMDLSTTPFGSSAASATDTFFQPLSQLVDSYLQPLPSLPDLVDKYLPPLPEIVRPGKLNKGKAVPATLSSALLMVYVDSVSNLPFIRKDMEPTALLELNVGKQVQKTYPRPKTPNPVYQQKFIFFVNNPDSQVLKVEAKDESCGSRSLGETSIPIRSILLEKRLELYQQKFQLALGPHSSTLMLTVRLRFLLQQSSSESRPSTKEATDAQVGYRPFGCSAGTNQLIIPALDLNGSTSTGDEAWRNTAISSGAVTPNTKVRKNFATRAFDRLAGSNSIGNKLRRRRRTQSATPGSDYGKLEVSFVYQETKKKLVVTVHGARNLSPVNEDKVADPYVKVRLLKDGDVVSKKETGVKHKTLEPRFEETFMFDVKPEEFSRYVLVLDVKDAVNYGLFASKPVLGQLVYDLSRLSDQKSISAWLKLSHACYDNVEKSKASSEL